MCPYTASDVIRLVKFEEYIFDFVCLKCCLLYCLGSSSLVHSGRGIPGKSLANITLVLQIINFYKLFSRPESIELCIGRSDSLGFVLFGSSPAQSLPPPPVNLPRPATHRNAEKERQLADWRGGKGGSVRGAESYDRKRAWSSRNHSVLSGADRATHFNPLIPSNQLKAPVLPLTGQ